MAIGGGLLLSRHFPFESFASSKQTQLTILHTNDLHSRFEKFTKGSGKFEGLGGVQALNSAIEKIREETENVLLFDAGDFLQCSSEFEKDKGKKEIKNMCSFHYDAATLGEHDFAAGLEILALRISDVFGLCVALDNVQGSSNNNIRYKPAIPVAISVSEKLKKEEHCNMVICLSHLGYDNEHEKVSDKMLAMQTENIDLIIGGHTHTFLDKPAKFLNKNGKEIIVNHAGWGGINIGCLQYSFDSKKSSRFSKCQSVILIKETIAN